MEKGKWVPSDETIQALHEMESGSVLYADSFEEILESIGISLAPVKKLFKNRR